MINVKKLNSLKSLCSRLTALWRYINFVLLLLLFNGDTAYITQLKQKSKRCYYFCSTSP